MEYHEIDDLIRASVAHGKHPLVFTPGDFPKLQQFADVNGYHFNGKELLGVKVYATTT